MDNKISNVLALDSSTHFGYAIFKDGKLKEHNDVDYSDFPWIERFDMIYNEVCNTIKKEKIEIVCIEEMSVFRGTKVMKPLIGMITVCRLASFHCLKRDAILIHTMTAKARVIKINFTGDKKKKEDIVKAIKKEFGITKKISDNEADAINIGQTFLSDQERFLNQ